MARNLFELSSAIRSDYPLTPTRATLYPFQIAGVEYLSIAKRVLIADEMGLGKSVEAIVGMNVAGARGYLVICPASLCDNWRREITAWGLVEPFVYSVTGTTPPAQCALIMSYGHASNMERLAWAMKHFVFDGVITDECFGPETKIETKKGLIPISEIKPGDVVLNAAGWDIVLGVKKSKQTRHCEIRFDNGRIVRCSLGHQWFTEFGWIAASDLKKGYNIVTTTEAVRMVRGDVYAGAEKQGAFLREVLLSEMANEPAGVYCTSTHERNACKSRDEITRPASPRRFETHDRTKSNAQRNLAEKSNRDIKKNGVGATHSRWQRHWANRTGNMALHIFRFFVGFKSCCKNKQDCHGDTRLLQTGYSKSNFENRSRVRRVFARFNSPEKTGHEKRNDFSVFRVASVTLYESGNYAGNESGTYYDLEIRNHPSFSVGGALVHNCHFIKSPAAQRTRVILGHHGVFDRCEHVYCLSGTPVVNRPIEIYPLVSRLCPKSIDNMSMRQFGERFCEPTYNPFSKRLTYPGAKNMSELAQRLRSTCMVRRLKKDVLKLLPPKIRRAIYLDATSETKKLVEREIEYHNAFLHGKFSLTTANESFRVRVQLGYLKVRPAIDYIKMLLETCDKVLVFGVHREPLARILAGLATYWPVIITGSTPMADRQRRVDFFQNAPECRVFIGAIDAAGVGYTLTSASHVVIVEADWRPGVNEQAEDRAHRIGQRDAVTVDYLVFGNSVDEKVLKVVQKKARSIDALLNG